jgi:hypothetical protein
MDASNTPEKVPPDEAAAVKRQAQSHDSLPQAAKRLRQGTSGPAVLTESPLDPNDTPPRSPSPAGRPPPPAPPSTPASVMDTIVDPPMDLGIVQNASALEQQQRQWLGEDVATPLPTKSTRAGVSQHRDEMTSQSGQWVIATRSYECWDGDPMDKWH